MMAVMGAAGEVQLDGRSLHGCAPEDVVREGVALVPEGRHIYASLTVEENLRLGVVGRRSADGLADDRAWVQTLFPVVREFAGRKAGTLSGGQQQQLAIGRAAARPPHGPAARRALAGTRPDGGADGVRRARRDSPARGDDPLVEQRAQLTVGFADRTYVMANGELRLTLTPRDAHDTDRMMAAYFGR